MGLTYIYSRLDTTLKKLMLVTLLEKHAKGLETLGEQLTEVVQAYALEEAFCELILQEYMQMAEEELHEECDTQQLYHELTTLLQDLERQLRYRAALGKPRAVHFEFPATVILEYPPSSIPQKPKEILHVQSRRRPSHFRRGQR